MAAAPVRVAPGIVRAAPGSSLDPTVWRLGPRTDDGYWFIERFPGSQTPWAVRLVFDPAAPRLGFYELGRALEDATHADRSAQIDAYLSAVSVVSTLEPDELTRLRDAVLEGKAGGADDGAPRRRRRKPQLSGD